MSPGSADKPGETGDSLEGEDVIFRLATHTRIKASAPVPVSPADFDLPLVVSAEDFALSSLDKKTDSKWISVYEEELTAPHQVVDLLKRESPQLILRLKVGAMQEVARNISGLPPRLDVYWDRRPDCTDAAGVLNDRSGSGAAGHCGVHGLAHEHYDDVLDKPASRKRRRSLRQRLARLAEDESAQIIV